MDYNFRANLNNSNSVFCGKCNVKTSHSSKRDFNPDTLLVELIRVTELKSGWRKNNCVINFPITKLALPGFSRLYRVAASCDHSGSLLGGHWFTKLCTSDGVWYVLDDLKVKSLVTRPPGIKDSSVAVILLIAEDKLSVSK